MMLLTKAIKKALPKLYSQEHETDKTIHIKFFLPGSSWTWFIAEGQEQKDGDWLFFGVVYNNMCPDGDWGYTTLSQLKEARGRFSLKVERDTWFNIKKMSQVRKGVDY